MAQINQNEQLMVGADPEFLVVDPNTGSLITRDFFELTNSFGNIGSDCCQGEIRPSPGSPRQVVENIRTLIQASLKGSYKDKILLAGGGAGHNGYIGGHIHFNIFWSNEEEKHRHLKLLDRYIGIPTKAMTGGQRYTTCYGQLSGYDTKSYGFEYRTPPSWLTDPRFAEAILSVSYLITEKLINDSEFALSNTSACTEDELELLIPKDGPFKKYWAHQVHSYAEYIFGGFNLATEDMRERWTAPALIDWKRGDVMVDLMVGFRARAAAALAETRRLEAERAQALADRQRVLEAERTERENRACDVAAAGRVAAASVTSPYTKETRIWTRIADCVIPATSVQRRTQGYLASVFIHRHVRIGTDAGYQTQIEEMSTSLNIGFLKVIEHSADYEGWSNHCKNRAGRRYRCIRSSGDIVYMSADLKPLIKRSRGLPFKIKFVEFRGPQGLSPRTISFHKNADRNLHAILLLFMSGVTKRHVPQSFYLPESMG